MRIRSFPESDVPADLRLQVLRLQHQAWPDEEAPTQPRLTHDPKLEPVSLLLVVGERVVSALDILSKAITHAGETYRASGLSTVVTDAELRGRGYGLTLVRHAREQIAGRGADVGIFTCDTPLLRFYEAAGWQHLPGTVLVGGTPEHPFPSDQFDKVTLGAFFADKAVRHAADFVGQRIPLYPGEIDKLW